MSRTVWVVAEYDNGRLHRGAAELVSAARGLGDDVVGVVCGGPGTEISAQMAPLVDRVIALESDDLTDYTAGGWSQAIVAAAGESEPVAILLPHAPLGRDLGPILAARLGGGMMSDCLELAWDEGVVGTRSVHRRKLVARERVAGRVAVVTCQRGAFAAAPAGEPGAVDARAVTIDTAAVRTRLLGLETAEAGDEDITDAAVVVAGGRGLGDAEKFRLVQELATALGGVMAASRPVVDQGWVPHDRQVGSSGVTVRPKLYFALGISGAIQHIVGMRESDVIVAINKDGQAPIFEYAHYGIVDDLFKVVPALIEGLRKS